MFVIIATVSLFDATYTYTYTQEESYYKEGCYLDAFLPCDLNSS
jgi:hypothetical protein